jgi:hypothetical protein
VTREREPRKRAGPPATRGARGSTCRLFREALDAAESSGPAGASASTPSSRRGGPSPPRKSPSSHPLRRRRRHRDDPGSDTADRLGAGRADHLGPRYLRRLRHLPPHRQRRCRFPPRLRHATHRPSPRLPPPAAGRDNRDRPQPARDAWTLPPVPTTRRDATRPPSTLQSRPKPYAYALCMPCACPVHAA